MAQNQLTRLIVERWRLPLAIHIMDDWPSVIYTKGLYAPWLRTRVLREFRGLLDRAAVRMVISGAMAAEYRRRYHYSFVPFHNALDMAEWSAVSRQTWDVGGRVTIRYVGSIVAEAQRDALRDLCGAVAELRGAGIDLTLSVHAPAAQAALLRGWNVPPEVLHLGAPPQASDVPRLLSEADILVLPFNFDDASRQYMRYSMPTKVPAYMISGSPVLVYGPSDLATVAYAAKEGWGLTVSERGGSALTTALRQLASDVPLRERIGRRAIAIARRNHDAASVTQAFKTALTQAVIS
jgi:glycosyltransferase involved in cell wall biosynthesis